MKSNRVLGLLFVILSLSLIFSVSAFATDVWIEGYGNMTKEYGDIYVNEDNRTMVPIRAFAETMGCDVEWVNDGQYINISKHYKSSNILLYFTLQIGNTGVWFQADHEDFNMDTTPVLKDGRTYIPLRYAAEIFDYVVEWDDKTKSVKCYHI